MENRPFFIIAGLPKELDPERCLRLEQGREMEQLKAPLLARHRRQFKGRTVPAPGDRPGPPPGGQKKKRGAPKGHPPWGRAKPQRIGRVLPVLAPQRCPHCQCAHLNPVPEIREHIQEDIVLEPRVVATCFVHQQAYCPGWDRTVIAPGPGELPGSYIGPATKATAIYLRYLLNGPTRKISQYFEDFFGLKFVPASAYGFERQAARRGEPIYADLLVADGYASYNGVHPKDRQSCLAPIKTKAKELEQELALLKGEAADPRAPRFCQDVQGWVHDACQAHHRLAQGPWRAKDAKAKARELKEQLMKLCRDSLRYPKTEKLRLRLLGPEQKLLLTCFRHPGVPPTNNQAQRSLRSVVIMRRVIQGTRSDKELENHPVRRSLFETARRQGKKPHRFFLDLFTKDTAQAQAALYRKPLDTTTPKPILRC